MTQPPGSRERPPQVLQSQYLNAGLPDLKFYSFLHISLKFIFIYILAVVGLCCCAQAFSSCGKWRLLLVAVLGFLHCSGSSCCRAHALGVWASLVAAHGLSSCGLRALECRLKQLGHMGLVACCIFLHQGSNWCPCIARQILNHWIPRSPSFTFVLPNNSGLAFFLWTTTLPPPPATPSC